MNLEAAYERLAGYGFKNTVHRTRVTTEPGSVPSFTAAVRAPFPPFDNPPKRP